MHLLVRSMILGVVCAPFAATQDPKLAGDPEKAIVALTLLTQHCARCHGSQAPDDEDDLAGWRAFHPVDNLAMLSTQPDYTGGGDPGKAKILALIKNGEMPQDKDLSEAQKTQLIDAVSDWIRSLKQIENRNPSVTDFEILERILNDLRATPAEDQRYARYFTLANLWNLNEPEQAMERYRQGLAKLVNSLSWAGEIHAPKTIDSDRTILRVDLRALGWHAHSGRKDKWDLILDIPYPYGILPGGQIAQEVYERTGSPMPYVRADWFAFHASRPPVYELMLAPRDQPDALRSEKALEAYLGVDVESNIRAGQCVRIGIAHNQSRVSANNRLIERHELPPSRWPGAYWKSYDFKSSSGKRNLLNRPLGPRLEGMPAGFYDGNHDLAFVHDGGELIWSLPNGLQGYLLVDARGVLLDNGPPDIVYDPNRSTRLRGIVVNGISCIVCHSAGMQLPTRPDAVRPHVQSLFSPGERERVLRLYPPANRGQELLASDRERFISALHRCGIDKSPEQASDEPVLALARRFEDPVSLRVAAAELGLDPKELIKRIGSITGLEEALTNDALDRDEWVESFPQIVDSVRRLGKLFIRGHGAPQRTAPEGPESNEGLTPKDIVRLREVLRQAISGSYLNEGVLGAEGAITARLSGDQTLVVTHSRRWRQDNGKWGGFDHTTSVDLANLDASSVETDGDQLKAVCRSAADHVAVTIVHIMDSREEKARQWKESTWSAMCDNEKSVAEAASALRALINEAHARTK